MKTRMIRKVAVLVASSALALSFPVASSVANKGGVPNGGVGNSKPCPSKGQGSKHTHPSNNGSGHGKKCGFDK